MVTPKSCDLCTMFTNIHPLSLIVAIFFTSILYAQTALWESLLKVALLLG